MKFKDIYICSDLDGTLLNENNEISKENLEAIEYFRSHGGKFMIATGRVPDAIFPAIGDLKTDFPCVCLNGCGIYDLNLKEYVETVALDDGVEIVAREIMEYSQNSGVEIFNDDGICVVKRTKAVDFHLNYEKVKEKRAGDFDEIPKPWLKILFAQSTEETEAIREKFLSSHYNEKYTLVKTHNLYYEIFNKSASKGKALVKLCKNYGIDIKNVIAIGDNENDITMLNAAGRSVAVANAPEIVKKNADIITCSNEEHAIADLIKKL